jgi:hypothetical protein
MGDDGGPVVYRRYLGIQENSAGTAETIQASRSLICLVVARNAPCGLVAFRKGRARARWPGVKSEATVNLRVRRRGQSGREHSVASSQMPINCADSDDIVSDKHGKSPAIGHQAANNPDTHRKR